MLENAGNGSPDVHRPNTELEFDIDVFLNYGRTKGYSIYASDGKPFLLKYNRPLFKDGRLHSFVISLIDPNISEKDIVRSSYISETFSHFLSHNFDQPEDSTIMDDSGLVIAEIALGADESGLLFLINDLNYKHITEAVLSKYYAYHQGQYHHIGRSMVGIAGRVLKDFYGIDFLAVKDDKTMGFYWWILGDPTTKPNVLMITKHLERIKDTKARKKIREDIYVNIIKNIVIRRFDPYLSIFSGIGTENYWENHCGNVRKIFSDHKPSLSHLLAEPKDAAMEGGLEKFIDQLMADYRAENIEWFSFISGGMHRILEAQNAGDRTHRDQIIDEIMNIEGDPIVKKWLNNFKQSGMTIDIATMFKGVLDQLSQSFPVFELRKINEIKIGIDLRNNNFASG